MKGIRLITYGGSLSDVGWLNAQGVDEAGLFVDSGACPSPAFIHDAGIQFATLFPFNDAADGPGTNGDIYAGFMQAVKSAGWDMIGGGCVSGDIVRVAMNYMPWCNYEYGVYLPPFNHPASGPNTYHFDYVDTIEAMSQAVDAGMYAEVGIRINLDGNVFAADTWIELIDKARSQGVPCNNVCFFTNADVVSLLQTDSEDIFSGIVSHYGIRHRSRGQ